MSSQSQPSNQSVSALSMFESTLCNALYFGRFTMTWFNLYNDRQAHIHLNSLSRCSGSQAQTQEEAQQ